jgi:hypothetical protein
MGRISTSLARRAEISFGRIERRMDKVAGQGHAGNLLTAASFPVSLGQLLEDTMLGRRSKEIV